MSGFPHIRPAMGTSVVHFPGDHGGFLTHPREFAALLRQTLD